MERADDLTVESDDMKIGEYELIRTCEACPEQYDVYKGGEQVAYLRLRHGHFYASVPDCGGDVVYKAYPDGDGIFDDDERSAYLSAAIEAVRSHMEGMVR